MMEHADARRIGYARHAGRLDRAGAPIVEHLERVAASVPVEARTVAYLHDILEHTDTSVAELEAAGVGPVDMRAIELLTRPAGESFEEHVLRIAFAKGTAGRLARMVKLADIDDHVSHNRRADPDRPYGWARHHIAACHERFDRPAAQLTPAA